MARSKSSPSNRALFSVAAAVLTATILIGCGGNGGDGTASDAGTATPPDSRTEEPGTDSAAARTAAESALLTLDDFPTGWTERPPEEDQGPDIELPAECDVLSEEEDFPGTLGDADSDEFHGPNDEEVTSSTTVFVDTESAEHVLRFLDDFVNNCREPFQDAMEGYLKQVASDEGPIEFDGFEVNIDRLSFPDHGDEQLALRISVNAESSEFPFPIEVYLDVIGFRLGRTTGGITFTSVSNTPDAGEEQRLLDLIEERLAAALSVVE